MTSDSLSQMLSDFLAGARAALVVEDGAVAFDLAESKYSISGAYNKCLLHLWSSERNVVRRVLDAEIKGGTLRLQVQRIGQNRPTKLDFYRDRDRRTPAARQTARVAYATRAQRALERHFPGWTIARLTTTMDLHRSFGPAYLRGLLQQGQRALAMVGVNAQETQTTIDGALNLRASLARRVPPRSAGSAHRGRAGNGSAEGLTGLDATAHGASSPHGCEVATV